MLNRPAGMTSRSSFKRKELPPRKAAVIRPLQRPVVYADGSTMAKPMLKGEPQKHAHLLAMAKGRPCLILSPICNHDRETTVACHGGGVANGKGMGWKVSDAFTCWGCSACNHYTDAYGGATAAQKAEAFERGHEAQLAEWDAIAGSATASPKDRQAAAWGLKHSPRAPKD